LVRVVVLAFFFPFFKRKYPIRPQKMLAKIPPPIPTSGSTKPPKKDVTAKKIKTQPKKRFIFPSLLSLLYCLPASREYFF
jgi:hypothetical protein